MTDPIDADDLDPELDPDTLTTRSGVLPTGGYGVCCSLGPDRAWHLPTRVAERHAVDAAALATAAEHDAAVVRLLTDTGLPVTQVGEVLRDVRGRRQLGTVCRTGPVTFEPCVRLDGKPFVDVLLDGRKVGQMTPPQLRTYAAGLLDTIAAVRLDATLHSVLTRKIELDDGRSRAIVGSLSSYWPRDGDRPDPEPAHG